MTDEGWFAAPLRPEIDIPTLPTNVTDLSEEDITDLMAQFTVWSDYVWAKVTEAKEHEEAVQRDLVVAEARAMQANWKGGTDARVAIAKASVATDEACIDLRESAGKAKALRARFETLGERLDRDAALLSRELTRRTSIQPVRKGKWLS